MLQLKIASRFDAIRLALFTSLMTTCVASFSATMFYPRPEWFFEITYAGTLTFALTFPLVYGFGVQMLQVRTLTNELREMVRRDRLTEAATRDYFFERMASERRSKGITLMVDIDHFKLVNDTHGHMTGDLVIRHVAQVLRNNVRPEDIVCRFGGEEFTIFLSAAVREQGEQIAERIREQVAESTVAAFGQKVGVTVSIGASQKRATHDIEHSLQTADEALYQAKETGRNKVICEWDGNLDMEAAPA